MGAIFLAVLSVEDAHSILLASPPVVVVLGWTYLANDEKISRIGRYVREVLRPELRDCGGAVFGWESFHRSDRRRFRRKLFQLLVDEIVFVGSGCVSLVVFLAASEALATWEAVVLGLDGLLLVALGLEIAIYADLKVGD